MHVWVFEAILVNLMIFFPAQVLDLKRCIGNLLISLIEENSPDSLIVAKVLQLYCKH